MYNAYENLINYMRKTFVHVDWGNFEGMKENATMSELMTLKGFLENAIYEKMRENKNAN